MLDVVYDKITFRVKGWNGDMTVETHKHPGQEIIRLDIDSPYPTGRNYFVDLATKTMTGDPYVPAKSISERVADLEAKVLIKEI